MAITTASPIVKNKSIEKVNRIDLFAIIPSTEQEQNSETNTDWQEDNQEQQSVDARNTINDLSGKEWLPETKSFFFQKGLGVKHPHAQIERKHPAPYSFQDISRLVLFFTKKGNSVLDPFGGVGSTAKACALNSRHCTSIELSPEWHNLSIKIGNGSC